MPEEVPITTPEKLEGVQKELSENENKWIFRGEKFNTDHKKLLKTSIEYAYDQLGGHDCNEKRTAEKDIIREFQRKLHLYTNNLPARPDILQWLALMQHHGAPTRLLDWTYSFWVAVHFAINRCEPEEEACLWAVNATEIVRKYKEEKEETEKESAYKECLEKIYKLNDLPYCDSDAVINNAVTLFRFENPKKMVLASGSFRRNQRLTLQQGTFLIAGDVAYSFQDNLYATLGNNNDHIRLYKITVTRKLKMDILKKLQHMNINNAVLFPDLDGFCESLWARVGFSLIDKLLVKDKDLILY